MANNHMEDAYKIKVLKYTAKAKKPITTYISNSLKNLQNTVGVEGVTTHIECVSLPISNSRNLVAVMDDEGKLKNLPVVRGLYDDAGCLVDCIQGVFFVCAEVDGEFVGLNNNETYLVKHYFRDGDL